MKKKKSLILIAVVVILLFSQITYAVSDTVILRLQTLGLIESYESNRVVTRAEAVNSFVKMLVKDTYNSNDTGFADVPADHKYVAQISIAKDFGIIEGETDGVFKPDEGVLGIHLVKMAVHTLGFDAYAENNGGYEEGYRAVAAENGLLTGFNLNEPVTMAEFAIFLDKMLDTRPLEIKGGAGQAELSEETLYEKITGRDDITQVKEGIVSGFEKGLLNGVTVNLDENEILIDGQIFKYYGNDGFDFLGQSVSVYYKDNEYAGYKEIIGILPKSKNAYMSLENDDILSLGLTKCRYTTSKKTEKTLKISPEATFIYNGANYQPSGDEILLTTGDVRFTDNNGDDVYDVVFIDEYESFIIERISSLNTTVYFKNNVSFRGKSSFKFDFEDDEKNYTIYGADGEEISFEDIKENTVITIKSDMNCEINVITLSDKTINGVIKGINGDDETLTIDGEVYDIYKPNVAEIYSKYSVGNGATFYLNNKNEIVFGDLSIDGMYAYVIGAGSDDGNDENIVLKLVSSGFSNKEVEISGDEEIIKYNYQNSMVNTVRCAAALTYTGAVSGGGYAENKRISASEINLAKLKGSVIRYKLNSEGEISKLITTAVDFDTLKVAPKYNFNGKLNSFGGLSNNQAFFVGNTTNVICIPENKEPQRDDYYVDVTVTDKGSEIVMPVNIDEETQIAECVLLMKAMNANEPKPFSETIKYSIVGKLIAEVDAQEEFVYKLDAITGSEYVAPYIKQSSPLAQTVGGLKCGDIILFNTKSSGEISNIRKMASMYNYSDIYGEDVDGTVFGKVEDVKNNRLDDFLNEMVDVVTLDLGGNSKIYKLYREDGPAVYTYSKSGGFIRVATADEIYEGGELFLLLKENVVKVAVIFEG